MGLITAPNLDAPDDFYQALIDTHQSLSDGQSQALNARLILLLSNHIGRLDVLREAFALAREQAEFAPAPTSAPPVLPTEDIDR